MNSEGIPVRCFLDQQKDCSLEKFQENKLEILVKIQSYIMGNDEWVKSKNFASRLFFIKLHPQFINLSRKLLGVDIGVHQPR